MAEDKLDRILAQWQRQKPDLDCAPMAVIGRLVRIHAHLERELQRVFSAHGLPAGGFDVLATLRRAGPPYQLSPNQLLDWMMITSGTMTHRVDLLEKAGLVSRRTNPDDRRSVLISLTPSGLELMEQVLPAHLGNERRLLAALSASQQQQLSDLLRSWLIALDG